MNLALKIPFQDTDPINFFEKSINTSIDAKVILNETKPVLVSINHTNFAVGLAYMQH